MLHGMGNLLSSESDAEEAQQLREEASNLRALAQESFEASQAAWNAGDRAGAADYKKERLALAERARAADAAASEAIFRQNNAGRPDDEIDLHGLYVNEALEKAEQAIQAAKAHGRKQLVFITGKGNNSRGGIPKVKPAMEQLMVKHQLRCTTGVPNAGCITVQFVEDAGLVGWFTGALRAACSIM